MTHFFGDVLKLVETPKPLKLVVSKSGTFATLSSACDRGAAA
jgi:hypothetical protein